MRTLFHIPASPFARRTRLALAHKGLSVKGEAVERVQRALDTLGQRAAALPRPTFSSQGWSAADMWLYTAEYFLRVLPTRTATFPPAAQVMTLGWRLPPELTRWAEQHHDRPDVRALD